MPQLHVECPSGVEHVWSWFAELRSWRIDHAEGSVPLTYTEIDSWSRLTGRAPSAEEVYMLRMLSQALRLQLNAGKEANR